MLENILGQAEFIALTVNVLMFLAFLAKADWPKAIYWGGTVLVVGGVILMKHGN